MVGKFVEYYGPGLQDLPLADRATIANMAPEYGATCGIFPIDAETLRYLRLTGRARGADRAGGGLCSRAGTVPRPSNTPEAQYSELLALDLATVEPSLAGPKRPQDRVVLVDAGESFRQALPSLREAESQTGRDRKCDRQCHQASEPMGAGGRKSDRCGESRDPQQLRSMFRQHVKRLAEARLRGDRGHHQLHQHVESIGA